MGRSGTLDPDHDSSGQGTWWSRISNWADRGTLPHQRSMNSNEQLRKNGGCSTLRSPVPSSNSDAPAISASYYGPGHRAFAFLKSCRMSFMSRSPTSLTTPTGDSLDPPLSSNGKPSTILIGAVLFRFISLAFCSDTCAWLVCPIGCCNC